MRLLHAKGSPDSPDNDLQDHYPTFVTPDRRLVRSHQTVLLSFELLPIKINWVGC